MKAKTVLITGSEGLIGSHVCTTLQRVGFKIVRFDLRTGQDILDYLLVRKKAESAHGIVHLAAVSRVVDAYKNPLRAIAVNVMGTAHVLEAAKESMRRPWIIFGSSREVYGEPRRIPVTESFPTRPINVYGSTKLAGESLVANFSDNYGLRSVILRFSNVYGGPNDHKTRVIPAFVRRALSGDDLVVNGGNQTFDFVHVDDAAEGVKSAISLVSHDSIVPHRTYHLASGEGTSITRLASRILTITKSNSKMRLAHSRSYDVARFVGDTSKAKRELGWHARVGLNDGLRRYANLIAGKTL